MEKKYNVGDRVVVIEDGEIRKGTISLPIDNSPITIVRFDDGEAKKINLSALAVMPKTEPRPEEKTEPTEKPEITITPTEFRSIAIKTAMEMAKGEYKIGLAFTLYSAELHKALFWIESDD